MLFKSSKFNVLDKSHVIKTLVKLQTKSCELDVIPTKILKEIMDCLIDPITYIVNISLSNGQFALEWKPAILRPLQKQPGQDTSKNNYRPVSNLNFLSKVVKKCVLDQYTNHLHLTSLHAKHQSPYKTGHSCETALLKICNDIFWRMEKKDIHLLIMLDLSAAFDTVSHKVLIDLFEKQFGVSGTALEWLQNY